MRRKLKYKFTVIFVSIIGFSVLVLGFFLTNLLEKSYIDALGQRLEKEANLLIEVISWEMETDIDKQKLEKIAKDFGRNMSTRVTIIEPNGKVLADSNFSSDQMDNHINRPEFIQALKHNTGSSIRYSYTSGNEMLYIAVRVNKQEKLLGFVRLALPLVQIKKSIESFWYSLIFGLTIVFLITILISYRISNRITKPIEHVTNIAKKITNRNYSERLSINRQDELGELGIAINKMAESLENQMTTIKENENRLSTVLNNMVSGVILVGKSGKIILANKAIEWLLGEELDEIIGKFHFTAGNHYLLSELIERSLKTGISIHTEIEIQNISNKVLDVNLAPIIDVNGELNGIVVVLHDITKIKRLENMRTEFVANVSHELKTPITAVKGFAETLLDGGLNDEEILISFLQIIYKESDRLHRLISDLLDLSKIEMHKNILNYELVDITQLIQLTIKTLKPQADKKGVELIEVLEPISAEVDQDRMNQVLINLITNAITYTHSKGTITVELKNYNDEFFKIIIKDTGIGIPRKSIPRIFERFYRVDKARSRESGGTGLGLAIVKHIIESHKGYIHVESEVQKGTTFTITLPKKENNLKGNN